MKTIDQLEKEINYHNNQYWVLNDPKISDNEYDELVLELKERNPSSSILNIIGYPSLNTKKIKHDEPMLSLDKVYDSSALISWAANIKRNDDEIFSIQPKYDGWAAKYQNNILATRGDGIVGENITHKSGLIIVETNNLTKPLSEYSNDFIGEIVIKKRSFKNNFQKIIRKDGKKYKTERSALTGLLSTKDDNCYLGRILTMVDYDLFSLDLKFDQLCNFNWEDFMSKVKNMDYPTDGIVIKLKDKKYSHSLGYTSHHPKGQIAFKYGNPSGTTELIGIDWAVGKNNTINPVALLKPVKIHGHEISKANLHNVKRMLDLDIKIGDIVTIERCGEIIPDIIKSIPGNNRQCIIITKCPVCNSNIDYVEPFLYCINQYCDGSLIQKLNYSLNVLDVKNIGKSTVAKMVSMDWDNLYKIFTLTANDLLQLEGFAETSANNLYNELQSIINNEIKDYQLLAAINIKGIGRRMSQQLLKTMTLEQLRQMSIEELVNCPNIGEIRAVEIYNDLIEKSDLIDDLIKLFNPIYTFNSNNNYIGKVCFTGKMNKPRKFYTELAEKAGYEVLDTVNGNLTYLVCQDLVSAGSKMTKADKLGINVIRLDEFLKML